MTAAEQVHEEPEEHDSSESTEGTEDSELDIEEYLESNASDYETFGTIEELYREADEAVTVDETVEPVYESESDIYITEESLEDLETSFEEINEELEEDSSSGILGKVKSYRDKVKGYLTDVTPNDKWDWTAYGSGLALGGIGLATGSIGLGAAGFLLEGIGLYRSNKGKETEVRSGEETDDYELGGLEHAKDKEIKAISRESLEEIQEDIHDE